MADSPAADNHLSEDGVRALLRAQTPEIADLPLRQVAEGWDNVTWRLGDHLAVRIPRRELAAELIRNEQRALPVLGPLLSAVGVRTPEPVVTGIPGAAFPWPWSVVPWIPGESALGHLPAGNAAWADQFASALRALHVPAPHDTPRNSVRGVPLRERDQAMRQRLERHPEFAALRGAWERGLAASASRERVWIHGDLHPGNVVVRDGMLDALIDFGDVTAGDPAYDLAAAWLLFDADGRRGFRTATGGRYDRATWERARGWAAYVTLVLLTMSDDRPTHLAAGRRGLAELS